MITDYENILSDDQAITATASSTNVIDLAGASVDPGIGARRLLRITVTEAFTNLTNLAFALRTSNTLSGTALASATTVYTITKLLAALTLGAKIDIPLPPGLNRYIDLNYTVTGSAPDAGKIHACIVLDAQNNAPVPDAD